MKKTDKENFLKHCRKMTDAREIVLFEYFLDNLFTDYLDKHSLSYIPQTTAMHLFLCACLRSCYEQDSSFENNIFRYFRDWKAYLRTDAYTYAKLSPGNMSIYPLPSFDRTFNGYIKGNITFQKKDYYHEYLKFNFDLKEYDKEEVFSALFEEDESGQFKNDFDKALKYLFTKLKGASASLLQTIRPFSTLGFLMVLSLPQRLCPSYNDGQLSDSFTKAIPFASEPEIIENFYFLMEETLNNEKFLQFTEDGTTIAQPFARYDSFYHDILSLISSKQPELWKRITTNPLKEI